MTQSESEWKRIRHVLQLVVVGILAQVVLVVVGVVLLSVARTTQQEQGIGRFAGLPMLPLIPGWYIARKLLGPPTFEMSLRVLLVGPVLNSLIYIGAWFVGGRAFRRWREWRREATRLRTLMEPPPSASAPIEDRMDPTTQTTSSRNRLRHAAKILLYVGVLGQIAWLVLLYLVAILRGGTLWKTQVGIPLPLFPLGPAITFTHVLVRPRGMHDFRFFLVGFLFNSLIYATAWLVGAWAIRGLRRPRQNGTG